MKHFIATRFNLRLDSWTKSKDGSLVLTDEWMEDRFTLFETYCLPSVVNQTNKNFYWFIFFDTETPAYFKDRIEKLIHPYRNIFVHYTEGLRSLTAAFKDEIRFHLTDSDTKLITTRLDNDDAIHRKFVETVQNLSNEHGNYVVDLRKGYQIEILNGLMECKSHFKRFNPFISFVEEKKDFQTVYSKAHESWKKYPNVVTFSKTTLWMQVIHKRNQVNDLGERLFFTNRVKLKEDFGIAVNVRPRYRKFLFFRNVLVYVKRILLSMTRFGKKILRGVMKIIVSTLD